MEKLKIFLFSVCVFAISLSQAQYNRYLSFDLIYGLNHRDLTPTQKTRLDKYLNHVSSCNVVSLFIDTNSSNSASVVNNYRVDYLKNYFINKGIDQVAIEMITTPRGPKQYVHNLADFADIITISISYSSDEPIKKFKDDPFTQRNKEKLLQELGQVSVSESSKTSCKEKVVLELVDGYSLVLMDCDYKKFQSTLSFNAFSGKELAFFKKVPELSDLSNILGSYHFNVGNGPLTYPALLKVPIQKCMDKYELTLFRCTDTACSIIPVKNIFDKESSFVLFELPQAGEYYLVHESQQKNYSISFDIPSGLTLSSLVLSTGCQNVKYRAHLENKKIKLTFPYPYYEPTIEVKLYDEEGNYFEGTKFLSDLDGSSSLASVDVQDTYLSKQKKLTIFKNYKIKKTDLRPVRPSFY